MIIHLVLFAGTAKLVKRRISKKRLWLAALLGSCSIFIVLTPWEDWLIHPLGKLALSILLVWTAFGFPSLALFFQSLCMFYVMSFLAAGTMTAVETLRFSMQQQSGFLSEYTSSMYSSYSVMLVLFSIPLVWFATRCTDNITTARKLQAAKIADISVHVNQAVYQGKALIDTGNQLKDPVTRAPVMVMEASLVQSQLAGEQYQQLYTMISKKRIEDLENLTFWEGRWRLVPFRSAGQSSQIMFALKPDVITVQWENTTLRFENVLVGLEAEALSANQDFQMIFPSDPLQAQAHESA
ncbi:sporulation factor SpoIIGA. Unknown type peptidase. MEROPS family U04 [Alteribacillus persepolensis]|uniref:Sporulation sigma-E factor-processing peptidase n=2 Tax=Alteribacillus persepolensis TaxID=568899 RepID=A0A1G7YGL0_9BACI|nr:sporulation factor SpoIIGA. Unknown type peptidase. MEROPS family U04 [Alteribacillus persepolensis]